MGKSFDTDNFASGYAPLTAYLALNSTGCTIFTSRTGIKKEIFRYEPVMALMAVSGIVLSIALGIIEFTKVI